MQLAATIFPENRDIRFLDPALGTGSFYSAFLNCFPKRRIREALGIEVDRKVAEAARALWRRTGLQVRQADFTRQECLRPAKRFNFIVCNPPYVRHHHLIAPEKIRLKQLTFALSGRKLSGLAGLYAHFLLCSHAWAADDAVCIWLIPAEFMDVNYGVVLKEYLTSQVTLLRVHRFDAHDVQFEDALVSSAIVCFRNATPPPHHEVTFSFGGDLDRPMIERRVPIRDLQPYAKWRVSTLTPGKAGHLPTLSDFFQIKRGLATGDNQFFILTKDHIQQQRLPLKFFRPILPSPRYLDLDEIKADAQGDPLIYPALYLLDCALPEDEVRTYHPELWRYLEKGKISVANGYLCRSRSPWYSQEDRPAPRFLCTYMGRKRTDSGGAFRFILNYSKATAANVYLLMYPKDRLLEALEVRPHLCREVWNWLRNLSPDSLIREGRIYGGGLHKLEPRELGNVVASGLESLIAKRYKPKVQLTAPVQDRVQSHSGLRLFD